MPGADGYSPTTCARWGGGRRHPSCRSTAPLVRSFASQGTARRGTSAFSGRPPAQRPAQRSRPNIGWGQLSRVERDVASSAATGLTAREIAEERGVTVNTIKFHLKNVYDKLGVATRVELARHCPD